MSERILAVLFVSIMGLTRCYKWQFLHLFKNNVTSVGN